MKRPSTLLLTIIFLFACSSFGFASATNVYITQTGSTSGNCTSNVQTPAFFNSAGNWGSGATQIGPGTTVLLCGTFNGSAGTFEFITQGNGTSTSPVIIQFDSNAILQAPYWGSFPGGCPTCTGAITIANSNIIVDGGSNGIIQNTADGSQLANQQGSIGIDVRAVTNTIIRNLTIQNIYQNVAAVDENGGFNTADIFAETGATGLTVCNNTLDNAHAGIWSDTAGSGGPVTSCTSNTFTAGANFFNNTLADHGWQMSVNGSGSPNIYNNDISNWDNWGNQPNGEYHTDGIITYGDSSLLTPTIYSNYFHGDMGTVSATGMIFCTYGTSGNGSGSSCKIDNNLFVGSGVCASGQCAAIYFHGGDGSNTLGPHYVYNNTFVNFGQHLYMEDDSTISYYVQNNIFQGCSGCNTYAVLLNGAPNSVLKVWNGNDGYGLNPNGGYNQQTLPQWQASGFDTTGSAGNPNLSSTYTLQSGSAAMNLGANLWSSGVALDTGKPTVVGADATDSGTPRSQSSQNWDSGAYPSGSGSTTATAPASPLSLSATVN